MNDDTPGLRITITPRFYETDALGHINNNALSGWFEAARAHYLRKVTGYQRAVDAPWVLAAIRMEFLRETQFDADASVAVRPVRLGNTSVTIAGSIHQNGELAVRGEAVMVHMDRAAGKPARIPPGARRQLAQDSAPDAPQAEAPGRG